MKNTQATTENSFVNESLLNQTKEENSVIHNDYSNFSISDEEFADEDTSFAQVEKFIGFVI